MSWGRIIAKGEMSTSRPSRSWTGHFNKLVRTDNSFVRSWHPELASCERSLGIGLRAELTSYSGPKSIAIWAYPHSVLHFNGDDRFRASPSPFFAKNLSRRT